MALELAKDFGLDQDLLKRHQVCELYSFGHDKLAEEVRKRANSIEAYLIGNWGFVGYIHYGTLSLSLSVYDDAQIANSNDK